jgi:CheY-like chemotaxis protein
LINQSHDRTSVSGLVDEIHAREEFNEPGVVIFNDSGSDFGNADFAVAKPVRIEKLHATICKSLQGNKGKISSAPQDSDALQREILSFGLKVLLVEDIPINMQVARHMLKGLGCEVIEATNGREGLDKISLHEPDVVLMDCQMPVMDGYTATRERREYETQHGLERLPIVALTANALAEDRQKCLDAGMDDFVSKPFRKEDLINVLERSVGGAEAVIVDQVQAETVTPANDEGAGPGPVIDKSALDQIADLDPDGSGQLLGSIIDSYLDNAEELVAELGDAIDRSDIEIATRAAHSLKSAAANVGAISFSALCADMERHGRAGDIAAMAAVVDQAKQEHEIAARELANYKTEIAA